MGDAGATNCGRFGPLIGSIDEGTSSTRFLKTEPYSCAQCEINFSTFGNLRRHVVKFHPDKKELAPLRKSVKTFEFKCEMCNSKFNVKNNYTAHVKKYHIKSEPKPPTKVICALCNETVTKDTFSTHVLIMHNLQLIEEKIEFSSPEQFTAWKDAIEQDQQISFIKKHGTKATKSGQRSIQFYCHRSGYYQMTGIGSRKTKLQGSKKINSYCPASIKVTIKTDGTSNVTYLKTHVGHENDLCHLTLSRMKREELAAKIAAEVPLGEILEEVFAAKTAEVLTYHQIDLEHITPEEGWVEMDPIAILQAVIETINVTCDNLKKLDICLEDIVATGITNQRETTVLWDKTTGQPLYNALVWLDMRTASTVDLILQNGKRNKNFLKGACGLPVSTYFSALKIRWMMDNVAEVKKAIAEDRCYFGTIDSWLIWNLTGGPNGGIHVTDVTNASRTMLMNIITLKWDSKLCKIFGIPMSILPKIRSSSEIYGYLSETVIKGIPISGCLGDQQSALVGQMCFQTGQAKCTYGTGCFLLYNTGPAIIQSTHGLLTTVAYQFGKENNPVYALEGSIAIAGVAMRWLRDNLQIINNIAESAEIAQNADSVGEVVFVPAFSGLYAPYWRKDARSVICGLTEETKPAHIVKGALEAVAFQVRDILEAMSLDCGFPLCKLLVDGGMTSNSALMQIQADYCGIPVVRPFMAETTALGAAIAAGGAKGVAVWDLGSVESVPSDTFAPTISEDQRDMKYSTWKKGIARCLDWVEDYEDEEIDNFEESRFYSLPAALYFISSMIILTISNVITPIPGKS